MNILCVVLAVTTAAPDSLPVKPDYSAPAGAPYTAVDVIVPTPMGYALAGTLTLPRGASAAHPVPAVVTITGSGPEDRDEMHPSLPSYRPFRQIADSLGRRGIAVLRMDDRGVGQSGGTFKGTTDEGFRDDIRAGLAFLRTRPEIDAKRLGLVGHSEGAMIAPMVAEQEPSVRAIVLLAGVAGNLMPTLRYQLTNQITHNAKLTPTQKDSALAAMPHRIDSIMASDPWWRFILTHDFSADQRQVTSAAVLILTGEHDQQAQPKYVPEIVANFEASGNHDVTSHIIPGVDHLFVTDPDGFPGGYAKLPAPLMVRSDVVGAVADWLALELGRP
jgi:alpha/beta superfamily hydrolase